MYLGRGLCRATRAKVHALHTRTHTQKKKEKKISQRKIALKKKSRRCDRKVTAAVKRKDKWHLEK